VAALAERFEEAPKGEITLVLAPVEAEAGGEEAALQAVDELVSAGTPRRLAVDVVARLAAVSRNELYRASL
jgi:16S rRNA C1402 (ribose-2'-O) methylase RsmI